MIYYSEPNADGEFRWWDVPNNLLERLGDSADQAAIGRATCDCPSCAWIDRCNRRASAPQSTAFSRGLGIKP